MMEVECYASPNSCRSKRRLCDGPLPPPKLRTVSSPQEHKLALRSLSSAPLQRDRTATTEEFPGVVLGFTSAG
eukprot:tig00000863_g5006.t1